MSCPPFTFKYGTVCIDKQPALLGDGSQGPAVSWVDANTICAARGARLCTEAEREAACPGGPEPALNGANATFCGGPAATWEWSGASCTNNGHCNSPCCNAGPGSGYECNYGACEPDLNKASSYHCCKTAP